MHEERQGAAIRMGSATSTLRLGAAGATVLIAGLGPSGWMSAGLRVSVLTQRVSPAVVLLSARLAVLVRLHARAREGCRLPRGSAAGRRECVIVGRWARADVGKVGEEVKLRLARLGQP